MLQYTSLRNLNMTVQGLRRIVHQLTCWVVSVALVSLSLFSHPVLAQSTSINLDTLPPLIQLSEVLEGSAGDTQVFTAEITDDVDLLAVLLFYRLAGDEKFASIDMRLLTGTNVFTASLDTDVKDARDIEYFIQAEDTAGNRAIKGFTFDPLIRVLNTPAVDKKAVEKKEIANKETEDKEVAIAQTEQPLQDSDAVKPTGSGRSKLLWGAVGVLAVAVIAVVLQDDDQPVEKTDPVTVTPTQNPAGLLSIQW